MAAKPKVRFTREEYLAYERDADYKSEFFQGEIFAMAGASEDHNLIVTNLVRELSVQLKGRPCRVYPSDMRVWIPRIQKYTYPDVTVVCSKPRFDDVHRDNLLNPTVLIEVVSEKTEAYDRGRKFDHYSTILSFTDYLLVSQTEPKIDHYVRQANDDWVYHMEKGLQSTLNIPSIQCVLALAEVYDRVEFNEI